MTLMIGSSKITPSIFPKNNIKNQDKTITENGVYTADEGYTGLGEVTVDVEGGSVQVEAKNYTGTSLSEGDKVWINSYVIVPENPVAIPPFNSNQNYATVVPDEDGLYYWLTGDWSYNGYYRTSDNFKIATISGGTTFRYPIMFRNGTRYQCYISGSNTISTEKASKGTYWLSGYMPVCNNSEYMVDITNKLLCRIDSETGTFISSTPINTNTSFVSNNPGCFGAVLIDNEHLLIADTDYYNLGLFTLENGTFNLTKSFSTSNYSQVYRKFTGITSDGKYVITNTAWFLDISNILTNNTISWKPLSDFNIPTDNYNQRFNQNGDYLEIFYANGYNSNYPYLLYKYDVSTKTFNQISIDTDMSGHWVVATAGNNTIQVYQTDPGNSSNKGYIASSVTIDGTQLVKYKIGNITSDTQTGTAAENISAGSVGTVNVGAVIENQPKYQIGDRVTDDSNNDIGMVSGFFTDANDQKYAVVCLNAVNRLASGQYLSDTSLVSGIPEYNGITMLSASETATTNTDAILAETPFTSSACSHCRSKSFTIDGVTYYGQLPNIVELVDIFRARIKINTDDPTATQYSSLIIPITTNYNDEICSSTQCDDHLYYGIATWGVSTSIKDGYNDFVIPVLEIPLD